MARQSSRKDPKGVPPETLAVLGPFINVLRSSGPISIPKETLQGALAHFLSSLDDDALTSFVQDVLSSPSLWGYLGPSGVQSAIRNAAPAKVNALRPEAKDGWFKRDVLGKASRAWLEQVLEAGKKADSTDHGRHFLVGMLQGVDDVKGIDWGQPRVRLEEDVVLAIAEELGTGNRGVLDMYCTAADHIAPIRLRALDLKAIVPRLHTELFAALGFPPPPLPPAATTDDVNTEQAKTLAHGLASSIAALSQGSEPSQVFAWDTVVAFVRRLSDIATHLKREWDRPMKPASGSIEWRRQRSALRAFLLVAWPSIRVMLQATDRPATHEEVLELSSLIILTLSKFAALNDVDEKESTMDGYEKLLYGALDVLAGEGGSRATRALFDELARETPISDSLAAFILIVAEQLIHYVDAPTVRDFVLPLAGKYMIRPQHATSFQAAWAFLLALVEAASAGLDRDLSQREFVDSIVAICAKGLLREARDDGVTTEQLQSAYPSVVLAASRRSPDLVHLCLQLLENAPFKTPAYKKAVRHIRVAVLSSIPAPEMKDYLAKVADIILSTPTGSEERLELSSLAFNTIMKNMPDESKQLGIEWWLRWRRRFEADKETRARL